MIDFEKEAMMINYRGATHSQVVRLLRSSGPHPIFTVHSPSYPSLLLPPHHRGGTRGIPSPVNGGRVPSPSHRTTVSSQESTNMRLHIRAFKEKVCACVYVILYTIGTLGLVMGLVILSILIIITELLSLPSLF